MSRIDFYKKYYEDLTPSTLSVSKNENKILISGFENQNKNNFMQSFEKGGQTNFNPDGAIKDKIVHASGEAGGMLVGKRHSNGGIKAINKSTGQPIEMEGGEVVITRNAVSDNTKRSFNGKMMTNRQILSAINESGGGVSFANGGQVPNNVAFDCNAEYEYGGKTMCGKDLAYAMGGRIQCGNCDWSWNRKDGGDDMYVCHKCGTDNSKSYAKGGAVDDDFSDIISAVQTVDVMEDGGETSQENAKIFREVGKFIIDNPYNLNDVFFNENGKSFKEIKINLFTKDGKTLISNCIDFSQLIFYFKQDLESGLADTISERKGEYIYTKLDIGDLKDDFFFYLSKNLRNSKKIFNPYTGNLYNFLVHLYFNNKKVFDSLKLNFSEFLLQVKDVPVPNEKPKSEIKNKIDYDKLKSYLKARINALSTELNIKYVALSIDEIGIYQREIRELITRYRQLVEQEREGISLLERLKSAYSVKWGDISNEYTKADLVSINGKKTDLTEKEYLTVRTENFKSFFGDWEQAYDTNNYTDVSKVINEKTKEPLAVFHGTNVLFTNWKTYKTNNAHYFAKKREMANFFATSWNQRGDKAGVDSQVIKKLNPNKGEFIYRCFLDIKNPIDFSRFGVDKRPVKDYLNFLKINYNVGDFDFWSNIDGNLKVTQDTLVYAWQIIRAWQQFTVYVKIYTPYDGYIFYEFIPDSEKQDINDASLSFCTFDSNQVKFADAVEFNALSDDSRLKYGGLL